MDVGKPENKRNVVFVLGMHRSGTSAVSRLLSLLGCDLPKTLMPESPDNARGYWESLRITHLNDAILASGGSDWDDWLPFNAHWYNSPVYASFVERGRDVLREEFGASPLFVLKDPRCARLVPYWKDVFERESIRPLVLIPIRNPLEVSGSISSRDHIHRDIVHLLWLRHVLDAEHDTRGLTRAFTTYEKLLANWSAVAVQLQERFGISWPGLSILTGTKVADFLDPSFRHYDASADDMLSNPLVAGWLRDTYTIMLRWASDGESRADYDELDRVRRDFNASGPAFAGIAQALIEEGERSRDLQLALGSKANEVSGLSEELASLHAALETTRNELVAKQAEGLADGGAGTQAEIATLEAAAQAFRDRLAEVEEALVQREEELRLAGSESASGTQRAETLEEEKRAVEDKLDAAESVARQQQEVIRATDEAVQHAESEIRDLRDRLAQLEDALRQREDDLRVAGSESASSAQRADALDAEKRAIEAKLRAADEAAQAHHGALRASDEAAHLADAEIRDLRDRLAYLESTLRQREEEVAQAGTENGQVRERVEALEAEKRKIKAKLEEAEKWVFQLAGERQQGHARIARLEVEIRNKELALKAAHRKVEQGQSKHRELEILLSASRTGPGSEAPDVLARDAADMRSAEIESDAKDERIDEIARLSNALHEQAGQAAMFDDRMHERIAEIATLSTMLREQSGKAATVDERMNERAAEIATLSTMLREQNGKAATLDERMNERVAEIATLTRLLREQTGKIAALTDSQAAIEALADDRMRQVERAEALVGEISEASRQKDIELWVIAASGAAAQARVDTYATEVASLSGMLREQQGQIDLLDRGYAAMERLAADRLAEIERLKAAVDARNGSAERTDGESLVLRSANAAMQARLEKTSVEISALTNILIQEERKASTSAEQTEWLRKVMPVLLRTRWWHKLVTKDMVTRRKLKMLQRKGLFDAEAYVARYPDVLTAGIDPLQHYIIHGMNEDRVRVPGF